MSLMPPVSKSAVSQFDEVMVGLAAEPGQWSRLPYYGATTSLKRRYGRDFDFVSRTDGPGLFLWGVYIGAPGKFSIEDARRGRGRQSLISRFTEPEIKQGQAAA